MVPVLAPTLDQDQAGNTKTGTPQSTLHFDECALFSSVFKKSQERVLNFLT